MLTRIERRQFLAGASSAALGGIALISAPVALAAGPTVFQAAKQARQKHLNLLKRDDIYGVVDFSLPSYEPRLFLISAVTDKILSGYLCAHGRGSDPGAAPHAIPTSFSNKHGSKASSIGSYLTVDRYISSEHGPSLRLKGLDPTNSNAFDRDIVIHSNWYVTKTAQQNKSPLGRSWGCFVTAEIDRDNIIDALRDGAFLYAGVADEASPLSVSSLNASSTLAFEKWRISSNGDGARSYISTINGRTLLEYTMGDDDSAYIYLADVALPHRGQYRLKVVVETGHSPAPFTISVENAVEADSKQQISKTAGDNTKVTINSVVETIGNSLSVKIRSQPSHPAKIWAYSLELQISPN